MSSYFTVFSFKTRLYTNIYSLAVALTNFVLNPNTSSMWPPPQILHMYCNNFGLEIFKIYVEWNMDADKWDMALIWFISRLGVRKYTRSCCVSVFFHLYVHMFPSSVASFATRMMCSNTTSPVFFSDIKNSFIAVRS